MNMDSLVDLVRALTKKCDDYEYEQRMHKYYESRYQDARKQVEELRLQLQGAGISPDA